MAKKLTLTIDGVETQYANTTAGKKKAADDAMAALAVDSEVILDEVEV
tara:strand:- start:2851 stop:2994 length:144 start_codon:yes stop_codon:yes gene_type:complete